MDKARMPSKTALHPLAPPKIPKSLAARAPRLLLRGSCSFFCSCTAPARLLHGSFTYSCADIDACGPFCALRTTPLSGYSVPSHNRTVKDPFRSASSTLHRIRAPAHEGSYRASERLEKCKTGGLRRTSETATPTSPTTLPPHHPDGRRQTTDRRRETGDRRQETGNGKRQMADG